MDTIKVCLSILLLLGTMHKGECQLSECDQQLLACMTSASGTSDIEGMCSAILCVDSLDKTGCSEALLSQLSSLDQVRGFCTQAPVPETTTDNPEPAPETPVPDTSEPSTCDEQVMSCISATSSMSTLDGMCEVIDCVDTIDKTGCSRGILRQLTALDKVRDDCLNTSPETVTTPEPAPETPVPEPPVPDTSGGTSCDGQIRSCMSEASSMSNLEALCSVIVCVDSVDKSGCSEALLSELSKLDQVRGYCPESAATTETPSPETPSPETPAPETPAPETPSPETPAPETPSPETPAPETPAPETNTSGSASCDYQAMQCASQLLNTYEISEMCKLIDCVKKIEDLSECSQMEFDLEEFKKAEQLCSVYVMGDANDTETEPSCDSQVLACVPNDLSTLNNPEELCKLVNCMDGIGDLSSCSADIVGSISKFEEAKEGCSNLIPGTIDNSATCDAQVVSCMPADLANLDDIEEMCKVVICVEEIGDLSECSEVIASSIGNLTHGSELCANVLPGTGTQTETGSCDIRVASCMPAGPFDPNDLEAVCGLVSCIDAIGDLSGCSTEIRKNFENFEQIKDVCSNMIPDAGTGTQTGTSCNIQVANCLPSDLSLLQNLDVACGVVQCVQAIGDLSECNAEIRRSAEIMLQFAIACGNVVPRSIPETNSVDQTCEVVKCIPADLSSLSDQSEACKMVSCVAEAGDLSNCNKEIQDTVAIFQKYEDACTNPDSCDAKVMACMPNNPTQGQNNAEQACQSFQCVEKVGDLNGCSIRFRILAKHVLRNLREPCGHL